MSHEGDPASGPEGTERTSSRHPWGPGSVVATRFRLEDLLDERAGARFWRATDLTLARNVAIHVLPADDRRAQAVLTAARTSATVSEPHLLRVLDAVEEDEVVHVVHEWGSGESLDRLVAEQPLDARRAAWLVREVARAVAATHAQGVAHGRLLPENVLVTDSGSVKLIGFVVDAVLYGRLAADEESGMPTSEHENDVRNLGALLYAALVGRWPGLPASVVPDAPLDHGHVCRARQVRAGVPRELDELCGALLRPHAFRSPRSHTASTVAEALSHFLGEAAPHAVPALSRTGVGADGAPPEGSPDEDATSIGAGRGGDLDPEATQASAQAVPPVAGAAGAAGAAAGAAGAAAAAARSGTHPGSNPGPVSDALSSSAHGAVHGADAEATRAVPAAPSPAGAAGEPAARPSRSAAPDRAVDDDLVSAPPRRPYHGMGAGAADPHWGPDHDDTGALPVYEEPDEKPGSSWLRLGAALAALLLIALVAVVVSSLGGPDLVPGNGDDTEQASPSPSAQPPQPVQIAAASDFDPEGDPPEENPELVPLAVDGQESTSWRTSTYFDGPPLAIKSGVGLLLDLGEEVDVRDVVVQLPGSGYTVQLLAAPAGSGTPSAVGDLDRVATETGVGGRVVLAPDEAVTTRYVVVWLTALPAVDGGFQGQVADVVVRS